MKITVTLDQDEITGAIKHYVRSKNILAVDEDIKVDLVAGRGPNGHSAVIAIESSGPINGAAAKAANNPNEPGEKPAAVKPTPEEVEPITAMFDTEVAQKPAEKQVEATTSNPFADEPADTSNPFKDEEAAVEPPVEEVAVDADPGELEEVPSSADDSDIDSLFG